jgi:hypothetical protein
MTTLNNFFMSYCLAKLKSVPAGPSFFLTCARRAADCASYLQAYLPKLLIFRRLGPFFVFSTLFLSWKELISRRLHVFARKFFFEGYEEL